MAEITAKSRVYAWRPWGPHPAAEGKGAGDRTLATYKQILYADQTSYAQVSLHGTGLNLKSRLKNPADYGIINKPLLLAEERIMADVSYSKLWKMLEERHMLKTELIHAAGISSNSMARLGKNEDVRVNVLVRICRFFHCKVDDIMDILPENGDAAS